MSTTDSRAPGACGDPSVPEMHYFALRHTPILNKI